jgi:hypothetical protein
MQRPSRYSLLPLILVSALTGPDCLADAAPESAPDREPILTLDYLAPLKEFRDIHTVNIGIAWPLLDPSFGGLTLHGGAIITHASGTTTLAPDVESGSIEENPISRTAWGIGPELRLRWRIGGERAVSLMIEGLAGVLLYDKHFPVEGDRYNFMFKVGPRLEYRIGQSGLFGLGYSLAHVSNGQGASRARNPSYDAHGISINIKGLF